MNYSLFAYKDLHGRPPGVGYVVFVAAYSFVATIVTHVRR